jgi:hypothetical protein
VDSFGAGVAGLRFLSRDVSHNNDYGSTDGGIYTLVNSYMCFFDLYPHNYVALAIWYELLDGYTATTGFCEKDCRCLNGTEKTYIGLDSGPAKERR